MTRSLSLSFLSIAIVLLTGCIRTTPRVVKIGLVAPFEGRYREIGYEVIPAARMAVQDYAGQSDRADISIELVAYDDAGDSQQAVEQARKLVIDPDVVIVIGHWRDRTTRASLPIYKEAGIPLITFSTKDPGQAEEIFDLAPSTSEMEEAAEEWLEAQGTAGTLSLESHDDIAASAVQFQKNPPDSDSILIGGPDWGMSQFYALTEHAAEGVYFVTGAAEPGNRHTDFWTDERTIQFVAGFEASSLGTPPGLLSLTAYEATWLAISLATGSQMDASPLGPSDFEHGRRRDAPVYLYRWEDGQRRFIEQLR